MIAPPKDSMASKPKKANEKANSSAARLIVWGVVLLLTFAAVFAYFVFFVAKNPPAPSTTEKPKVKAKPVDQPKKVAVSPKPQVAEKPEKAVKQPEAPVKKPKSPPKSREEREKAVYKKLVETPLDLAPKTNRIFRTGIEASMARIFMTRPGDPPPPPFTTALTIRDEAHLAEILMAADPVLETDTQAQADSKEMVALAKKEMADYIKNGGDPEGFLTYYRGKLQEAFDTRRESMVSLMKIAREEPELAADFLARINANLAEKGIRTIELTDKQKERMGLK